MRALLLPLVLVACQGPATSDDDTGGDTADSGGPGDDALVADAGEDRVTEVGVPLTFDAIATGGEALWDFGDGSEATGASVSHTWTRAGNHVVVLQVTSPGGRRATDTVRVVVHNPLPDAPPVSSSSVAVGADGGTVVVAVPEADHVAVIDTATQAVSYLPTCAHPRSVALVGGRLAATCEHDDALFTADRSGTDTDTVDLGVGARPFGVVGTRTGDGPTWWVAAQGRGEIVRIPTDGEPTTVVAGDDVRALAVDASGEPWASRWRALPDHAVVVRARGEVQLAKDPGPDSDTGNRGVPTALNALAVSPDGTRVFVGGTLANVDRGEFRETDPPEPLTFETTLRATLRVIDTSTGAEEFVMRRQFDNHGQVNALALTPLGNWLFVAHQGTHSIERLDAYTLRAAGVILDAGHGVDGMAVSPDGTTLYVHAWLDRELRAYDIADPSVPAPPLLWTVATVEEEPLDATVLAGKRLFHDSTDTRMAMDGYQTCNACHPDGRDDGITWDFTNRGEGLRNTITLEGHGGMAMGPVHWSGNFDEIQDFENDIRYHQKGTGLLPDSRWADAEPTLGPPKAGYSADLDALAAYVASLVRTHPSPYATSEGAAQLFVDRGCATCHDPATAYTDSSLDDIDGGRHDVGSMGPGSGKRLGGPLDGIDTPTLLGVWETGPYLHDGSAVTIEDAILAHDGGEFDATSLTKEELGILADHVRSLPAAPFDVTE